MRWFSRVSVGCRVAVAIAGMAAASAGQWSKDINPGAGPALLEAAMPELAAIVKAPAAERERLIAKFVAERAVPWVEAWKRVRNPELEPLFIALLEHADWMIVHRALFVLESYADPELVPRFWKLVTHPEARVRERAALACLATWNGGKPPGDVDAALGREPDFHVRSCLAALKLRIQGKLKPKRLVETVLVTTPAGLKITPFLPSMDQLATVATGVTLKQDNRTGGGAPTTLVRRWVNPLLGMGKEAVSGVSLQPFANLRGNGTVYHTGLDVGACLEGAGFYAIADGVVRFVHSGSDMGTLIVVEHLEAPGHTVCSLYMHGGEMPFVEPGQKVTAGQLLATMGLGFSVENGGHFAHLHFGLYPGPFSATHNYGYKPVKAGLEDWYDPATWLPQRVARTEPLWEARGATHKSLARATDAAAKGEWAEAHRAAAATRDAADSDADAKAAATALAEDLARVPERLLARANATFAAGYPAAALKDLQDGSPKLGDLAGADGVRAQLEAWGKDPLAAKALKGETRVEAAEKKAAGLKDHAQVVALFQPLEKDLGDTCLAARIKPHLR